VYVTPLRGQEALDPIRCWWRTSAGAVAIGESFTATLTCAARDQESVRTVPDESRLSAATIQLAPFESVGGSHPPDLRSATHRFFQYHYTLRVIDRDAIGRDVKFPTLQIAYRVHTRVNGEWTEGRERAYIMPGQPIRVLSLVPAEADDIRDSSDESFERVEALRFRSRALQIAAGALVVLGVLTVVPAVVTLARRRRGDAGSVPTGPSRRATLSAVETELAAVAAESRGGWTPQLASRALKTLRLAAACALQRDVAHEVIHRADPASLPGAIEDGRLLVSDGVFRRRRAAVSSPMTAADVNRAIARLPLTEPHERRQLLERLGHALTDLSTSVYGAAFNAGPLDAALEDGRAAVRGLRRK
jgi:hypothetical protein